MVRPCKIGGVSICCSAWLTPRSPRCSQRLAAALVRPPRAPQGLAQVDKCTIINRNASRCPTRSDCCRRRCPAAATELLACRPWLAGLPQALSRHGPVA